MSATGSDADGDPLTFTWSGCAGADGTAASCTIPTLATQSRAANVTISDGWASVTRSVLVRAQNRQPNVEASGGSSCHPRPGQPCTVPVTAVASDPDGDPVTLTWFDCASGSGWRGKCRIEALGPTLATATARDVFGAQRLASVTSFGVNQAAHAIASPQHGTGASATYTLSWSDDDGDIVTCQLTSSDARCEWQGCSVGGLANGTRQCDVKVASGTRPGSLVCELRLSCRDEWNHGNDAVFQHTYRRKPHQKRSGEVTKGAGHGKPRPLRVYAVRRAWAHITTARGAIICTALAGSHGSRKRSGCTTRRRGCGRRSRWNRSSRSAGG